MIPVEIRMALWDLMDAIENVDGLTAEDKEEVAGLYERCSMTSDYILAQQRAQTKEA